MKRNSIIPYNPGLRNFARELRKNSTLGEILLWKEIRRRKLGVQFHRQVPVKDYIIDFYCHEVKLAIEVDGSSHNSSEQKEKDLIRDYNLEQLGITVIRIDDLDVKRNMDSVVRFLKFRIKQIYCSKE
ncbi:MAG: endonuclease domain-containing protein [Balneolaceae bacterium]